MSLFGSAATKGTRPTRSDSPSGPSASPNGRTKGLTEFHLLVHQPDSIHTPDTCRQFARLVKQHAGLDVQAPTDLRVVSQGDLFA